jgi:hypothetical protein
LTLSTLISRLQSVSWWIAGREERELEGPDLESRLIPKALTGLESCDLEEIDAWSKAGQVDKESAETCLQLKLRGFAD